MRPTDVQSAVPGAAFVAHASGGVYYWVGAPEWSEIPPLERVWFSNERDAQDAGYRPAAPWQPIDELEILREIGRGATSIVYHARDRVLGRDVAVKVVQSPFGTDPETAARFAQEARLLAALRHPNIVSAFAVKALQGGGFALVMEYVRGSTLREVVEREGPLPVERVEQILRDVASALAAAHQHGIVHRDVKPDNVFLEEATGRALLADFGIAIDMENPSGLTMLGTAVGTPNYMSPEQIDGLRIDGRSDLYGLGLMGWEMLSGEKPWKGEGLYSVIYKQKNERLPTLRRVRSDVPPRLAFAIERALAKDPAERWESAWVFLEQLADESWSARWARALAGAPWKRRARAARAPVPRTPAPTPTPATPTMPTARTISFARPSADEGAAFPSPGRLRRFAGRSVLTAGAFAGAFALASLGITSNARRGLPVPSPGDAVGEGGRVGADPPAPLASPAMPSPVAQGSDESVVADVPDALSGVAAGLTSPGAGEPPAPAAALVSIGDRPINDAVDADSQSASDEPETSPLPAAPPVGAAVRAPASPPPLTLPVARGDARIATGGMHSCRIDARQAVLCWGGNDRAQLAVPGIPRATTAVRILDAAGASSIDAGGFHSCAINALGSAVCWGDNGDGQLGGGNAGRVGVVRIQGIRFSALTLGLAHTCGVDGRGNAYCWGSNANGQLGDGSFGSRSAPTGVRSGPFASLAAGWSHTCGLTRDGRALCWGDNGRGQLGDGTRTTRAAPTDVGGELTFRALAAGSAHTCGIAARGGVYCWGQNSSGQLGDGTTTDRDLPARVAGELDLTQISAGARHTCGLDRDGGAYCWGQNSYGQLGTGASAIVPTRVAGGLRFVTIRSSGSHTCAATADGSSYCWGYNVEGQVGDGTQTHRPTPQRVSAQAPPVR